MKLIKYIKRFLSNYKRQPNPFAEAIAEGIQEAFREMGYNILKR